METSDTITALVALYGAALSTCTAIVSGYLGYCRWRERTPDVNVKVYIGLHLGAEKVYAEASNPGNKAVILSSMGFYLPSQDKRIAASQLDYGADFRRPHELQSEHRCRWWITPSALTEELRSMGFSGRVKLVGFYEDQVGRTYKSKPFKFDVDNYA